MTAEWPHTVERDDGMDDENYHTREVYANFGLAIYCAQVLEHGVVNLLAFVKIFPDPAATRDNVRAGHGTALCSGFRSAGEGGDSLLG